MLNMFHVNMQRGICLMVCLKKFSGKVLKERKKNEKKKNVYLSAAPGSGYTEGDRGAKELSRCKCNDGSTCEMLRGPNLSGEVG